MTENEAIEKIKYRMHTAEHVTGEGGMEDLEMAVNALEEIQRWHTSVVNPNIKNEFANRSTQICVNCDHKDEYIEELEAEVEPYRALEKRLTDMFGGELSLEDVTDELERYLKEPDNPHPINAKILTYEDAAAWDAYHAIGTPEELQELKKDFAEALSDWRQYRKIGTLEECQAAMEKQIGRTKNECDMVHSSVLAWGNGVEIDDASYLMFAIFYVGDCILMQNRRASDGKID